MLVALIKKHILFHISMHRKLSKMKMERTVKGERLQDFQDSTCSYDKNGKPIMIKEFCIKLKVDRLGNISKATQ